MDRTAILNELRSERDKLDVAIRALESGGRTTGNGRRSVRTGMKTKARRTHGLTPEGRRRLSMMMKKRWAERRKQTKSKAA
jgi:hypothetical protein